MCYLSLNYTERLLKILPKLEECTRGVEEFGVSEFSYKKTKGC